MNNDNYQIKFIKEIKKTVKVQKKTKRKVNKVLLILKSFKKEDILYKIKKKRKYSINLPENDL